MELHNIENVLNMYNYFDSVIVTDAKGVIKYYTNMRTDVYNLDLTDIVGKTILEIHPELTEETSSIMRVLRSGEPIFHQLEHFGTLDGRSVTNLYSTLPLIQSGTVVGTVDLARCVNGNERKNIVLPTGGDGKKRKLYHLEDIVGTSTAMKRIKIKIPQIANTDSSVLIYGETGTGKELIAQAIHTYSNRHSRNFVSQNCAAIPSGLLESILFGTVRGAYTGAENRAGLFEVAGGGTLFLDEINSMELPMQAKILKAIEEKAVTRLGGTERIPVSVKIISATNLEPMQCVAENRLREDLFYRLNVVRIDIPPLRERTGDILYLTSYFIQEYNGKMNRSVAGIDDDVKEIFMSYHWPGNVRELQNVIEGVFNIIHSRVIQKQDLPGYIVKQSETEDLKFRQVEDKKSLTEKMDDYEKQLILRALDSSDSIAAAAKKLLITKQGLNYKLIKHNLK